MKQTNNTNLKNREMKTIKELQDYCEMEGLPLGWTIEELLDYCEDLNDNQIDELKEFKSLLNK